MIFYLVIPTINGEISGEPSVFTSFDELEENVNYECTVYLVNMNTSSVFEVDYD